MKQFLRSLVVRSRSTLNPYQIAATELTNRIRWDLTREATRSRHILKNWHNKHAAEPPQKAVIICNGPSLLKTDFSLLDGIFTFGLNKINLLFEQVTFRPSCIVSINPYVIEQNANFFNSTSIPLFIDRAGVPHIKKRRTVAFLHSTLQMGFAKDCSMSVFQGYTVTFVAMQLAFHMGFRRIALIGCDHNFSTKGPANLTVEGGDEDPDHFDPNYFAGIKWQLPDLVQSEIAYMMAGQVFETFGGSIVNCTDGGKLEVFPRMSLEEFLK